MSNSNEMIMNCRQALSGLAGTTGAAVVAATAAPATQARTGAMAYPSYRSVLLPVTGMRAMLPVHHVYCNGTEPYPGYFNQKNAWSNDGTGRQIPYFFQKGDDSVIVPGEPSPYPLATKELEATVQLVVAIGSPGQNVSVEEAGKLIFGYAAGVSLIRADFVDLPEATVATAADGSALCSPILPARSDLHMKDKRARLAIDGVVKQDVLLGDLPWRPVELIARLSTMFPLQPGDLIYCGSLAKPVPVKRGQTLTFDIDGIAVTKTSIA